MGAFLGRLEERGKGAFAFKGVFCIYVACFMSGSGSGVSDSLIRHCE